MRADRLLTILMLLQANGRMPARALAQRLEVSERTIHRDMEALSVAGVPVYAERGTGGGWCLPEKYRSDLTGLSDAEVRAVFMAGPAPVLRDLGLQRASEGALAKLLAALPSVHRRYAEHMRQRLYVDVEGWHRSDESAPLLGVLQDAVWRERRLQLTYRRGDGTESQRVADPLGLVARGSTWYLVAAVDGEVRTYRASRVQAAELIEQPCARPEGFDLAEYWRQSKEQFVARLPRYLVTVRASPEVVSRMRWGRRVESMEGPDDDGWSRVTMRFDTIEDACAYVLTFGPDMEALEPHALRERLVWLAEGVLRVYRDATAEG